MATGASGEKDGCAAGGAAIPKSANKVTTADLDGDGRADTIWLAVKGNARILGVQTASGARFSTSFTNAAPTTASAVANRLGDGTAIILLDFSRSAQLYAVVDCAIVESRNAQGQPYTFGRGGFSAYGTGVGCPVIGSSGRHLVGYLERPSDKRDGFTVTRTTINLSKGGALAVNGTVKTLGTSLLGSDPIVKTAQDLACGTGYRVLEPAS